MVCKNLSFQIYTSLTLISYLYPISNYNFTYCIIISNTFRTGRNNHLLEAKVGQKYLTWIRLVICYIVPWWPYWLSDQIAFSNSETNVVLRVSRLLSWPPSRILELNDVSNSEFPCHPCFQSSFGSI